MGGGEMDRLRRRIVKGIIIVLFLSSVSILTLNYMIMQNPSWGKREPEAVEVLGERSLWRYMEEGKDPSVGKVWTTLNYDASFWKAGYGSFGTNTDFGANNLLEKKSGEKDDIYSYFFRYEFEVEEEQADKIGSIVGEIAYKDAVVIYLNGSIVFTGNIPEGGFETNLEAGSSEAKGEIYNRIFQVTELSALQAGRNVLSVEIHQSDEVESDIYFSFPSFSLLEDTVKEPDYEMEQMILTKSERDDELYVNYVSGLEEAYRVEYMEADYYTGAGSFARYGDTEYMGSCHLENSYLNRVKLKRLKQNMDYVYRIIRVGGKEGSEVFRFSTGKNYKAIFGITTLPDTDSWSTPGGEQEEPDFLAIIGKGSGDRRQLDMISDRTSNHSRIREQIPLVYTGEYAQQEETLWQRIFGSDDFYLLERDIAVIGSQSGDEAKALEQIRKIRNEGKHKWIILLKADLDLAEPYLDAGATVVVQRPEEGGILASCKEEGKIQTFKASYVEVAGYENRLEVRYFDDRGNISAVMR